MIRSIKARTAALATVAAAIAVAAGTTAASAAPMDGPGSTPVNATVTVQTGLTVTGISGAVDFGTATVGSVVTKAGAEQYEIATNSPGGYTVNLSGTNQDWQRTGFTGQFTGLGNQALSVKNNLGATVTAAPGAGSPVLLEHGAAGDTHISEDWILSVPSTFTDSGAMNNQYSLNVQPA